MPSNTIEPPEVIDPDELDEVAAKFGVNRGQVLRDHMISHVLAAISAADDNNLIFFGAQRCPGAHCQTDASPRTST